MLHVLLIFKIIVNMLIYFFNNMLFPFPVSIVVVTFNLH